MRGPIGYELSPLAEEASQIVFDTFHPGDVRATRLREIIEVMDVEISSRGQSIQTMNTILGYDNSDGKHCIPGPHDLAKRLVETRDYFLKDNQRLKAELEKALEDAEKYRQLCK